MPASWLLRAGGRHPIPTVGRRVRWTLVRAFAIVLAGYAVMAGGLAWATTEGVHGPPAVGAGYIGPRHDNVFFLSRDDGVQLAGWLFHAASPNGRSVVFVHGWRGTRLSPSDVARDMLTRGYDVLLFDLRGSGESDAVKVTFGTKEARDVLGAYDFMVHRGYQPERMVMFGLDTGAAAIIGAADRLTRVGAMICDSAYSRLGPLLERGWTAATGLPGGSAVLGLAIARVMGVDPDLSPVGSVVRLPGRAFLFIQGDHDPIVPIEDGTALRAASAAAGTELVVIPGAAHLGEYAIAPDDYLAAVYGFVDTQLNPPAA